MDNCVGDNGNINMTEKMPVKGNQQAVQQADTEGDMSRDAGNLFQYFTIHTDVSLAHPSLAYKADSGRRPRL